MPVESGPSLAGGDTNIGDRRGTPPGLREGLPMCRDEGHGTGNNSGDHPPLRSNRANAELRAPAWRPPPLVEQPSDSEQPIR
jgi:hypothetical protein